jgi:undecaprenyl-diphosphatase
LLENKAETVFRSPLITAAALIILGLLLWIVDRAANARRNLNDLTWMDALLVGCAQIGALIPGVSRSGSTMTAGRALGFDRNGAAAFSFLMSMPIIAAAAILKVPHVLKTEGFSSPLIIGVLASAVSGWFAIRTLIRYVSKHSYGAFAIYRVLIGFVVLAIYYTRG